MKIQNVALSYLAGSTSAFYSYRQNGNSHRQNPRSNVAFGNGGFGVAGLMIDGMNNNLASQQQQQQNQDNNDENSDNQITTPKYDKPRASGALHHQMQSQWIAREQDSRGGGSQRGRTANLADINLVEILTPETVIQEGHEDNIMILSSDYMFVSNCLLKGKNHDNPMRQRAFDLFKQTAAGDWFLVFGYVCNLDYRCWKKSVTNLLERKGEEYGGQYIGRCVGRLVREKADGLRTRRKRRSIENKQEHLSISHNNQ